MSDDFCSKRVVWSNGDSDECGKSAVVAGLCSGHLSARIHELRGLVSCAREQLQSYETQLEYLEAARVRLVDELLR